MINKIVAVQGNHPSTLNPLTDTSVFLANEIQKKYKIFYYDPKDLSIINKKVLAKGFFIKFNYQNKKFYKIIKEQTLNLEKCKFILIRQDPPPSSVFEQFYGEKLLKQLGSPRHKGEPVSQFHRNIARSIQDTLVECAISLVTYLHHETGETNLCLAGGVALNCSANSHIANLPFIEKMFVQPASSDRGLALGCAMYAAEQNGDRIAPINNVFYGPSYSNDKIRESLDLTGADAVECSDPAKSAAKIISEGGIIGWFQGRSEFGPRALGNRSILANPSLPNMKNEINKRVKFREEFRPFAPSVLQDRASEIFGLYGEPLPYMTIAVKVNDNWLERLPATTHIDNSARVQTVSEAENSVYHQLISNLDNQTGIPVVLNTSFNIRGQPIVETPLEAISTFAGTGLDAVFIGPYMIRKKMPVRS